MKYYCLIKCSTHQLNTDVYTIINHATRLSNLRSSYRTLYYGSFPLGNDTYSKRGQTKADLVKIKMLCINDH